jgi:hypothetical protein
MSFVIMVICNLTFVTRGVLIIYVVCNSNLIFLLLKLDEDIVQTKKKKNKGKNNKILSYEIEIH